MHYVLSVIAIIMSLSLVIGIHEGGHAVAATFFKVSIRRISIGFGRPLVSWRKKNGCEWVWALWPLGGYVQLLNTRNEMVSTEQHAYCFDFKSAWARLIILFAGAGANLLMAMVALTLMFMITHQQIAPIISSIRTPSLAATAALAPGDRVIEVAGRTTHSWQDVGSQLMMNLGKQQVSVIIARGVNHTVHHQQLDLSQWSLTRHESLLESLGILLDASTAHSETVPGLNILQAMRSACSEVGYLLIFFITLMKQLITGHLPFFMLLGPMNFFMLMIHSFFQGTVIFLYFVANLNVAVAFVNLLPIPGLDGGSMLYVILEKIRKKPVSIAFEVLLYRLAFIALCVFTFQLLMNDLLRWIK
jgi:regulator of sigma E protease